MTMMLGYSLPRAITFHRFEVRLTEIKRERCCRTLDFFFGNGRTRWLVSNTKAWRPAWCCQHQRLINLRHRTLCNGWSTLVLLFNEDENWERFNKWRCWITGLLRQLTCWSMRKTAPSQTNHFVFWLHRSLSSAESQIWWNQLSRRDRWWLFSVCWVC